MGAHPPPAADAGPAASPREQGRGADRRDRYVQRNAAFMKPKPKVEYVAPTEVKEMRVRKPNKEILEHEKKRQIEVKVFEFREALLEKGCVALLGLGLGGGGCCVGEGERWAGECVA